MRVASPSLQLPLFDSPTSAQRRARSSEELKEQLKTFRDFGETTKTYETNITLDDGTSTAVETFVNEFWTSQQRRGHSLHEISYRACFKPQLPRFFIERLTNEGDSVYDPFMGRGTTLLEAALLHRKPLGCDANPLSVVLVAPRLNPPQLRHVADRLRQIDFRHSESEPSDLLVFYHPDTLREICALREYLLRRDREGVLDSVDAWIRMVAVNRLTGHSPGFFSVYTLPPNQAVSVDSQKRINQLRDQTPPRRSVPELILRKSGSILSDCDETTRRVLSRNSKEALLLSKESSSTPEIETSSLSLVVTSPPFLDIVDYETDNWLRCWFCGIDPKQQNLTVVKTLEKWQEAMRAVFIEVERVLKPNGYIAFEVGEVRRGTIKLEEAVIPCGVSAGLYPILVLINDQEFTKTSNCWGVRNRVGGTNTNRIVLFRKPRRQLARRAA
jgi:DNA modification methylase